MDYEKKYKEAVNKIKNLLDDGEKNGFTIVTYKTDLESIFPELKESEDERIRKAIISFLELPHPQFVGKRDHEKWLAWLEKQGEVDTASYEVAENEKREFVGDGFIKCYADFQDFKEGNTYWLEYIGNDKYNVRSDNLLGKTYHITPCQLYTIFKKMTWLEKQGECHISHDDEIMIKQLTEYFTTGHGLQNTNETVVEWLNDVKEKLEKQAEVVSDKDDIEAEEKGIREAFNKIEDEKQCKQKPQRMISAEAKEAMYNKPANTVEPKCEESKTRIFDTPTPFEDKLYAFVAACEFLAIPSKIEFILEHSQEILDAAREQIGKEQKSAWSEEDEMSKNAAISACKYMVDNFENSTKQYEDAIDWLKSLKARYTWKPSDEQMEALKNAIHIKPFKNPSDSILWGLYEQLNKLKS